MLNVQQKKKELDDWKATLAPGTVVLCLDPEED